MKQKDKYKHLSLEEKNRLYKWFKSQENWHKKQGASKWNTNQCNWYRNNSRWLFTFSEMVTNTFKKHSKQIANNIVEFNSLLKRFGEINVKR